MLHLSGCCQSCVPEGMLDHMCNCHTPCLHTYRVVTASCFSVGLITNCNKLEQGSREHARLSDTRLSTIWRQRRKLSNSLYNLIFTQPVLSGGSFWFLSFFLSFFFLSASRRGGGGSTSHVGVAARCGGGGGGVRLDVGRRLAATGLRTAAR